MKHRILVVDDEPQMRNLIRIYLETGSYEVAEAKDGREALQQMALCRCHAVILDLMMPQMNGWETCAHLRELDAQTPILMLTARTSIEDKITGFTKGADDYLTKPFDGRELLMRIKALLRRSGASAVLTFPPLNLTINTDGRTVAVSGLTVPLTPKEFDLLLLLCRRPSKTFSRDELLERIWGFEYDGDPRTVDSHIKNIREKLKIAGLEDGPLKTVWGIGYKFEVPLDSK